MKNQKIILTVVLALVLGLVCSPYAFAGNQAGSTAPEADARGRAADVLVPKDGDGEDPAASSEKAMENFVRRLEEGGYVVDAAGFLRTAVCSPDAVLFSYEDESYEDIALITLNGETFQGTLEEDRLGGVGFVSTEDAVHTAGYVLPNWWVTSGEGNMFNLFYNNADKPLEFVSYEDSVKMTLMFLAGYGPSALDLMHEVYMVLDAEDPTVVRFTAEVDDSAAARIFYDDLDLTLEFGAAETDPRVEAWLRDPVYPESRTEWGEDDLFYLNSVFFPGYGQDAIPFPRFASYAMVLDEDVFNSTETIRYTDPHGTREDLEGYAADLLEAGFTPVEEQSDDVGSITVYRRPLREEYRCYVSVWPHYDGGFVLDAGKYYDNPTFDSLEGVNEVLPAKGFAALPDSEHITECFGEDTAAERSESWLYFFDYDVCLNAALRFDDAEAIGGYLKDYEDLLTENGYTLQNRSDEGDPDVYGQFASKNGMSVFRFEYSDGDVTVILMFRNEKEISPEEAGKMIADAGIPAVELPDSILCRDIARYHKMTRGFGGKIYLAVQISFDSAAEAGRFLDDYVAALEAAGYDRTNPVMIGTLKENAYYNEEEDRYVSFDYFENEGGADVNLDFVSNV